MLRSPLLMLLLCSATTLAAPLYEIKDGEGNVTYTDQPPASSTQGTTKAIEQKPLNVLDPSTQNYQKNFEQNVQQRQQQRDTAWQQYDSQLKSATQALKDAQQAQKKGTAVKEGDMIGAYGGGVRPSEDYLERQQMLEQAVKDAEANLNAIKKQKPQLHR